MRAMPRSTSTPFSRTIKGFCPSSRRSTRSSRARCVGKGTQESGDGGIRRFRRRKSDKLVREMNATSFQQVRTHLLKVSRVEVRDELKRKAPDARIVVNGTAPTGEIGFTGAAPTRMMSAVENPPRHMPERSSSNEISRLRSVTLDKQLSAAFCFC